MAAYRDGQIAARRGQLLTARETMARCMSASCPGRVRAECDPLFTEISRRVPTVLLSCAHPLGASQAPRVMSIDGKPSPRNGQAIEVDPGEHVFQVSGPVPETLHRVVLESQREQRIEFACVDAPRPRPVTLTLALIGVSVVGAAGFVGFGLDGLAHQRELETCKGACDDRRVDGTLYRYIAADVSLGISAVALGVAAWLWFRSANTSTAAIGSLDSVHF
jgi:hypothetical protein